MELLIRSQSKMSLVDADNLAMIGVNENWVICKLSSSLDIDFRIDLGTYETKERALEVLDEIQKHIQKKEKMEINNDNELIYYGNVYEMPKE